MKKKKMFVCFFCLLFFSIFATQTSHGGEARLSWDSPTTNSGGTPLTNLCGYKIYYGVSSGIYDTIIDNGLIGCVNPTTIPHSCVHILELPSEATYYFRVTAYNTFNESEYSNEVSKTILPNPWITIIDIH